MLKRVEQRSALVSAEPIPLISFKPVFQHAALYVWGEEHFLYISWQSDYERFIANGNRSLPWYVTHFFESRGLTPPSILSRKTEHSNSVPIDDTVISKNHDRKMQERKVSEKPKPDKKCKERRISKRQKERKKPEESKFLWGAEQWDWRDKGH